MSLVEAWIAATNGGSLVEHLTIEIAVDYNTDHVLSDLVRVLQNGLQCDRAKGRVVGDLSFDDLEEISAKNSEDNQNFHDLIRKLNE